MIRAALKNPYLVVVLVLMVLIIGGMSLVRIPADLLPTYKTSAALIVCFYPGMPPEVMEQDIMSRLQRWTGQATGIEHQEAKAMLGVCVVKDFFHPHVTQAEALSQVSMYTMSDLFYLPPGTIPPMVMPFDPTASVPLCLVSVSNPDMTEAELYDLAYKNLRNNLQSISGVIAPAVNGGTLRRILAYVDPDKLRAYNLSILDVHKALRQQNVLIPAGSAKIGDLEFYIYTNAIPDRVETLNNAPIKMDKYDQPILFKDVGEVQDARQIQTNIVRVNGRRLVYVPVYRQPGANTIEIMDRIHQKLPEIAARLKDERRLPDGSPDPKMQNLSMEPVMDQSVKVRESIWALEVAMGLGAIIAGAIVWLFLRNWRSTIITLLAIPISIITSLIGLYFTGNTINAMTLGGLALAVGILIDQAIVVIDNIERHLQMGKGSRQAAWEGTREVAVPLFVSAATFIVVFFPIIFLSGLAKFLFTPLAMAVSFAILAAYLVAMFFVPVAAAKLMKRVENRGSRIRSEEGPGFKVQGEQPGSGNAFGSESSSPDQLDWLVRGYRRALLWSLQWKWAIVLTSVLLFVGSLWLTTGTGSELFPPVDSGQFRIYVRAPSGTRIEKSAAYIKQIENEIVDVLGDPAPDNPVEAVYPITIGKYDVNKNGKMDHDEIEEARAKSDCRMIVSEIGVLMDWPAAYSPNAGPMDSYIMVQFKSPEFDFWSSIRNLFTGEGQRSVFDDVTTLRERLNEKFPAIEFAFDTGGILTAALNMGEPSPIHLQVTGYTLTTAHQIAEHLIKTIKKIPGAVDVRVAQRIDYPVIRVEIDRVAAADRGVNTEQVMKSLVSATNSSINFDPAFWINPRNGNHYFLGTQYYEHQINSFDTLHQIYIRGENGETVELQDVAQFKFEKKPMVINHRNITRVTDVFANVQTGYDMGTVVANMERELMSPSHPLSLRPIKDSRSAAAKYPEWFQTLLKGMGIHKDTRFAVEGDDFKGKGFTLDVHGEIRSMRDSFVDFALGLVLATILVYLVMVAQFRSFIDPFIVLVTVPLGFIGVALILYLTGTRLNIQSFMGIIMMIGIVVEYAIVLLDFANHRLSEGVSVKDAIVDAALIRLRPILMTSLTTILALTPMAIGFAGGEADVPLARTIVGAVLAATLLLFFVVPCLYVMIKRPPVPSDQEAELALV